jgi:hypothetical protein
VLLSVISFRLISRSLFPLIEHIIEVCGHQPLNTLYRDVLRGHQHLNTSKGVYSSVSSPYRGVVTIP